MEKLIATLKKKYDNQISEISQSGIAEINIQLKEGIESASFIQNLQNHFVELVDELTIVKINIIDANGNQIDSFASNQ
ncbi:MAG: hypothetical protein EOO47_23435 [Flavobacterium sp.]|nr:MAG: hypothetical protein EOO47_23435 [Flavobacterium sp.]